MTVKALNIVIVILVAKGVVVLVKKKEDYATVDVTKVYHAQINNYLLIQLLSIYSFFFFLPGVSFILPFYFEKIFLIFLNCLFFKITIQNK
jgi:hypothetical protein